MTGESETTPSGPGALYPRWVMRLMPRAHLFFNRLTGGLFFNTLQGREVCFVTMKGAKSGQVRTTPLMYVPYEDGLLLVASQGGAHKHPAWYYNLLKNPDITVRYRGEEMKLRARLATAAERSPLWEVADRHYPPYAHYRTRTSREIPIFVCEPRP